MSSRQDFARFRRNWQDEVDATFLYRAMAEMEGQPQLAEVYRRMVAIEEKHAGHWEEEMRKIGRTPPARKQSWRPRALVFLARRLGLSFILPTIAGFEDNASNGYAGQAEARAAGMPAEEAAHGRMLNEIVGVTRKSGHGMAGSSLVKLEGRHRTIGGNALRAAVLGANDGLCSNLSLVMAVAGANLSSHNILITSLAGLLAGAGSMAMGEWLSVQSSREFYEREMKTEAEELEASPEEEMQELSLIYQAKGLPSLEADQLAQTLIGDRAHALDTLAREELGIDPEELGGSAWEAAGASFLLFMLGAIIPASAFFFLEGPAAIKASLAFSTVGLFGIGAAISLMTGRGVWFSGVRQVLVGLAAAGLTYGVGRLIGVTLAG